MGKVMEALALTQGRTKQPILHLENAKKLFLLQLGVRYLTLFLLLSSSAFYQQTPAFTEGRRQLKYAKYSTAQGGSLLSLNEWFAEHPLPVCMAFQCPSTKTLSKSRGSILPTDLSVRARGPPPAPPTCPVVSCPGGWVGYQGKCYYFAKDEGNWTSSKMHCSSLNASLALIDSHEEMNFMMRYKGRADHWLGLQRNLNESSWKWIDGTIFSGWFVVRGGGYCAYMNQEGVASSICSREEPWICSKPVGR